MKFERISRSVGPTTLNCSDSQREIMIFQADVEFNDDMENQIYTDSQIRTQLINELGDQGVPVHGERCTHEHDCCGQVYRGQVRIVNIDRDYNQVWTECILTLNV